MEYLMPTDTIITHRWYLNLTKKCDLMRVTD